MSNLLVHDNGKMRRKDDVELADEIIKLKNTKDEWAVIDKLIQVWVKRAPEEAQALKIEIADYREMLTDKEFGTTKDGGDFDRRFSLVFPVGLMLLLRQVYAQEELPMDAKFYREFSKHYPQFKVAEKN